MTTNELRIGNWALYPHSIHEPFQITEPRHIELAYLLKPIELSPELLGACGFEDMNFDGRCFMQGKYQLKKRQTDSGYDIIKFISEIGFNIQSVHYLHQLQNLYFALTGTELSINLEKVKV